MNENLFSQLQKKMTLALRVSESRGYELAKKTHSIVDACTNKKGQFDIQQACDRIRESGYKREEEQLMICGVQMIALFGSLKADDGGSNIITPYQA